MAYPDSETKFNCAGGDSETRPLNMAFHWIIKVAMSSNGADIPVGGLIPFAGIDEQSPPSPAWVKCDGGEMAAASVPDLFNIVGPKFRNGGGPTDRFNAPDLGGKFIRGAVLSMESLDPHAPAPPGAHDPDCMFRLPAPDGMKYGLGTLQLSATQFKNPSVSFICPSQSFKSTRMPNQNNLSKENFISTQAWWGGDEESRPTNVAVNFFLNSIDPIKSTQDVPIGTIIAIPSSSQIDQNYWLLCNGSTYSPTAYPDLARVCGSAWGTVTSSPVVGQQAIQYSLLPDLRLRCLRGADLTGGPNRDPGYSRRSASGSNGATTGVGSLQRWATGMPQIPLSINCSYPTGYIPNLSGDLGKQDNPRPSVPAVAQGIPMDADWDNETAPANVAVSFYVRAL